MHVFACTQHARARTLRGCPSPPPRQIWDGASPAAGSDGVAAKPGGRGKQLYLGSYDTELDAARCAWGAAPPGVDAL
jgi:hypothetical protein